MVSRALLDFLAALYYGDADATEPGVSPLFGDLNGLAPFFIQVGDHELLLDDSTRLLDRALRAGVAAELQIFEEAFHVFQNNPALPESAEALSGIGAFFDRVTV